MALLVSGFPYYFRFACADPIPHSAFGFWRRSIRAGSTFKEEVMLSSHLASCDEACNVALVEGDTSSQDLQ